MLKFSTQQKTKKKNEKVSLTHGLDPIHFYFIANFLTLECV